MAEDLGWVQNLAGLPKGYGAVGPNDPRIPKPAPDPVLIDPETERLLTVVGAGSTSAPKAQEDDDMPKVKASIYSAKGEMFVFSIEDLDNDPLEQFKTTAENIDRLLRPALEACGVKVVNRTGGDLEEAIGVQGKPTDLRARRARAAH